MRPISCQTHHSPDHATAPLRLSLPRSGEDGAVRQGAASGACRMRVALIYFGLARSVLLTFDSIQAQVLAPNAAAGVTLRSLASLDLATEVYNPRAGEIGCVLDPAEALLLGADAYAMVRHDEATIAAALAAAQRQPDPYGNDWISVRNLLHQLASLRRAWTLLEPLLGPEFDHVLFLRPDLLYLDTIDLPALATRFAASNSICVPPWHGWGGLNDRFAFADMAAARHYACRFDLVAEYCARGPLHAEGFRAHALARGECRVGALPVRARRVRAHGAVVAEAFDAAVTPLPQRPMPFRTSTAEIWQPALTGFGPQIAV